MPKLPDYRDVGGAPSASSGRSVLRASQIGGDEIGKAVQKVGKVVGKIAEDRKRKQDTSEALEADTRWQKLMNEHNRTYDTDPEYEKYGKRFEVASKAITNDVSSRISNPELRRKFILEKERRAEQYRNSHLKRATDMEQAHNLKKTEEAIQTSFGIYTAEGVGAEEKEHARKDIYTKLAAAESSGVITPAQANEMRRKYGRSLEMGDAQTRLHERPGDVQQEIKEWKKAFSKSHGGPDVGSVKIDGSGLVTLGGIDVKAAINPSAPHMARKRKVEDINGFVVHGTDSSKDLQWFVEYGQRVDPGRGSIDPKTGKPKGLDTGYHFYVDRDGTIVQGAPLNRVTNGAKGFNRSQIHVGLIGADKGDATPEQMNAARGLISGVGTKLGIKHTNVVGHGERQSDRDAKEGGGLAQMIRKNGYVLSGNNEITEASTPEEAERAAYLKSRYGNLTPQDLARIETEAAKRERVTLEVHRRQYKQMLADDIATIRAEGVGRDGLTENVLRDMRKVLTKPQMDRYMIDRKVAMEFHKGTKDIKTLTNRELSERIKSFKPSGSIDRAVKQKIFDEIKKAINDETKLRKDDPAASVDNDDTRSPVVEAFLEDTSRDQDPEGLIGARLEAQKELEILTPRAITKTEAARLLPNIRELPERERLEALKEAWQTVKQNYGVHADKVMRDAMHYSRMGRTAREEGQAIMRRSPVPEPADRSSEINDWEPEFMPDDPPDDDDEDDATAIPPGEVPRPREAQRPPEPADKAERPTPTIAAYKFARSKGAAGAAAFDELFYDGAFADATSRYEQSKEKLSSRTNRNMPTQ